MSYFRMPIMGIIEDTDGIVDVAGFQFPTQFEDDVFGTKKAIAAYKLENFHEGKCLG
jgi:hypothetical protein